MKNLVALEPEALRTAMAAAGEDARPRPDCPPADSLWRAARAELDPETAQGVVGHVSVCAVCAEAWDLALDLGHDLGGEEQESSAGAPPRSTGPRRAGAWLIAALLAVAVAVPLLLRSGEDTLRGGGGTIRSPLAPDVVLPRDDCRLSWAGPEGVESYVLELSWFTEDLSGPLPGATEMPAEGDQGEYLVPASDLREVPSRARLLCWVRALRDGEVIAETSFTVKIE